MATNVKSVLQELTSVGGFIGAALVDADSGLTHDVIGGTSDFDIEFGAAITTNVVRANVEAIQALGTSERVQDILTTLGKHYLLIMQIPNDPLTFFYLALRRDGANLVLARLALQKAAKNVQY